MKISIRHIQTRLTIRQYIAITAMKAMNYNPEFATSTVEFIAETAVKQADALIKELNK